MFFFDDLFDGIKDAVLGGISNFIDNTVDPFMCSADYKISGEKARDEARMDGGQKRIKSYRAGLRNREKRTRNRDCRV